MKHLITFLLAFMLLLPASRAHFATGQFSRPLYFIENKGQVHLPEHYKGPAVQYVLRLEGGLTAYISSGSISYSFTKNTEKVSKSYRMDMVLKGANTNAIPVADGQQPYYEQYHTTAYNGKVHSYARLTYKNIYPGIDWVLYVRDGQLEYDFVVHPGADVNNIQVRYDGAKSLQLKDDKVIATSPAGSLIECNLFAYEQETGQLISAHYRLKNKTLSFTAADHEGTLVIDPTLAWATYFGGSADDDALAVVVDGTKAVYIAGNTYSVDLVTTTGAWQSSSHGIDDGFIARFDTSGQLIWSTYFGGEDEDVIESLALDTMGHLFASGQTQSTTGIATPGAYQMFNAGGDYGDVFLAKFDTSGVLMWATYYGGDSSDENGRLVTDLQGNIFVSGYTGSNNGIATPGSYQPVHGGGTPFYEDGFLAKFNTAGNRLWGTYFGGSGSDYINDIAISSHGEVYIHGTTSSTSHIAANAVYQNTNAGLSDAFLAKFNNNGNIIWSTYYGGSEYETAGTISISGDTALYIGGVTNSDTGIATPGAYHPNNSLPHASNSYLAKFDSSGYLKWGTYYGNDTASLFTRIFSSDNDVYGNIYIVGETSCANLSTTGVYQEFYGGIDDGYITNFTPAGQLISCSYFGGGYEDFCLDIDCSNGIYIVGATKSATGIATPNAFQEYINGPANSFRDAFLARFDSLTGPVNLPLLQSPDLQVHLYPNPAQNVVFLQHEMLTNARLRIYDIQGRIEKEQKLQQNAGIETILIDDLMAGTYIWELESDMSNVKGKLVVIK